MNDQQNLETFTIRCTMQKEHILNFLSVLNRMEHDGEIRHSEIVGMFCDGDGTFRPKFEINISSPWQEFGDKWPESEKIEGGVVYG